MRQSDVGSRGRSGAEIKTRRADRGAENISIAPCKKAQLYGTHTRYHSTNKTLTFKQSDSFSCGFQQRSPEANLFTKFEEDTRSASACSASVRIPGKSQFSFYSNSQQ